VVYLSEKPVSDRQRVLYLSYTGLLEPLGRSQVLSYLVRLSNEYRVTLVTFEKQDELADRDAVAALRAECAALGIDWRPQRYHHRPRLPATLWDLLVLLCQTLRHSLRRDVRLVHCRSYIPAIAAWLCGKVTRKPFVFDMRALWPEEMVTAGRLKTTSFVFSALKWVERRLLRNAVTVVSLTEAGVHHLVTVYPEIPRERFRVITTCVDVDRFHVPEKNAASGRLAHRSPFVVGTMGTLLSGWFYLDAFFRFFLAVKAVRPDAVLSIVTRDDHEEVLSRASESGVNEKDIRIASASADDMPDYLAAMDVGVMFFAEKPGSAPTRLGEFLSAGVPVVGNTGIGDLGDLIRHYDVGTVIENPFDEKELGEKARSLLEEYDHILQRGSCRAAAETYFTVEAGAARYREIYRDLLGNCPSSACQTGRT
jgi:glycosyltransferase involved in cell wall biosynthesis